MTEIVHDDDVAWLKRRHEALFDIGEEAAAVDGPVDDAGCRNAVVAERAEEGHGAPAAVRRFGDQPPAPRRAPVAARHVGLRPGLVDEHEASRIKLALMQLPSGAPAGDVRPILLAGAQAFF